MDDTTLDPTLAETFRRVRARDDAPAPDPAFVDRLEEALMNHGATVNPHHVAITSAGSVRPAVGQRTEQVPQPIQPRTPHRPRLAVAAIVLVLLTVGSGLVANRQGTPSDPQDEQQRLAAFQLATPRPDSALCTIPPRTTGPSGDATTYDALLPPGDDEFAVGELTSEDQIPRGAQAPPAVVAGITATVLAHDACNQEYPGEWAEVPSYEATARILALYSDDYLRRVPTIDPPPTPPITAIKPSNYPPAWHPNGMAHFGTEVRQAWLLPDGRVSAVIGNLWQNPVVAVFVHRGDWWLIDELAFLNIEDDPSRAATPVLRLPLAAEIVAVPDQGFSPNQAVILPQQDVVVTLSNLERVPVVNFTIDALSISVDIQPGESTDVTINAPAGVYAFYSDIPGHVPSGMVGTLVVVDASIVTPS